MSSKRGFLAFCGEELRTVAHISLLLVALQKVFAWRMHWASLDQLKHPIIAVPQTAPPEILKCVRAEIRWRFPHHTLSTLLSSPSHMHVQNVPITKSAVAVIPTRESSYNESPHYIENRITQRKRLKGKCTPPHTSHFTRFVSTRSLRITKIHTDTYLYPHCV